MVKVVQRRSGGRRIVGGVFAGVIVAVLAATVAGCGEESKEVAGVAESSGAGGFEQTGLWGADSGVQFEGPNGLTVDGDGNVYSTEFQGGHLRKFSPDGDMQWETAGDGSEPGRLSNPIGAAVADDGTVYVSESGNSRVSIFGADGQYRSTFGSGGSGPGQFQSAMGIAETGGEVFVADWGNNRIQVFDASGVFLREWGQAGSAPGQFNNPIGVQIGPDGNVWVVDSKNERIQVFSTDGEVVQVFDDVGSGPEIISLNADGDFYVSSPWAASEVRIFSPEGSRLGTLGSGLSAPHGTATGRDGAVYVAETMGASIRVFTPVG